MLQRIYKFGEATDYFISDSGEVYSEKLGDIYRVIRTLVITGYY